MMAPKAARNLYRVTPVCHDISIGGQIVGLHDSGVLWWPDESTLVVADLHFEKASAYARRGTMLPPYDTGETLERLSAVINAFDPSRVIALGDSFHDVTGSHRMPAAYRAFLATLQLGREWIWVTGNHDPAAPLELCGDTLPEITLNGIAFRHEPMPGANEPGEVCGHFHPVAKVRRYGRSIRRRCFVTNGEKLILPAFGSLTGGLNVMDKAFGHLFSEKRFSAFLLGDKRLYPFTASRLIGD